MIGKQDEDEDEEEEEEEEGEDIAKKCTQVGKHVTDARNLGANMKGDRKE